jgi:hypothetical protein
MGCDLERGHFAYVVNLKEGFGKKKYDIVWR